MTSVIYHSACATSGLKDTTLLSALSVSSPNTLSPSYAYIGSLDIIPHVNSIFP